MLRDLFASRRCLELQKPKSVNQSAFCILVSCVLRNNVPCSNSVSQFLLTAVLCYKIVHLCVNVWGEGIAAYLLPPPTPTPYLPPPTPALSCMNRNSQPPPRIPRSPQLWRLRDGDEREEGSHALLSKSQMFVPVRTWAAGGRRLVHRCGKVQWRQWRGLPQGTWTCSSSSKSWPAARQRQSRQPPQR
ncbi:hypothetical protein B484DRAFT_144217 [Ochromonadaceae sp. CCMP2298]|nr:hypothetical protein B484DRAFT_144217 [Ochromonadaceae sp. CCMP2298]